MLCRKCPISNICIICDFKKKFISEAQIDISECKHYPNNEPINNKNRVTTNSDRYISKNLSEDRIAKLNELSNKKMNEEKSQQNKEEKLKPKISLMAKPLALDYECITCGANTFKDDIGKCSTCGKAICSCCATIDSDTKSILCEECWQKS